MKRIVLIAVVISACLEPGVALYPRADTTPPTVIYDLLNPRILGPDAGTFFYIESGATITVPFSEPLEPDSLRPGIVVRDSMLNEVPLLIQVPQTPSSPYPVRISSAETGFKSGGYSLQLRTLIIDAAGNPLEDQLTGYFRVR